MQYTGSEREIQAFTKQKKIQRVVGLPLRAFCPPCRWPPLRQAAARWPAQVQDAGGSAAAADPLPALDASRACTYLT